MSDATARLGLPMIVPGQAQKEMTHNEALAVLDAAVQAGVESVGLQTPPAVPAFGQCWIVGDSPAGSWVGHAGDLAAWTEGGWRFVRPKAGFTVWSVADSQYARFVDGSWTIGDLTGRTLVLDGHPMLAAPVAPIAVPSGGSVVDAGARTTIAQILAALRHHGLVGTA